MPPPVIANTGTPDPTGAEIQSEAQSARNVALVGFVFYLIRSAVGAMMNLAIVPVLVVAFFILAAGSRNWRADSSFRAAKKGLRCPTEDFAL